MRSIPSLALVALVASTALAGDPVVVDKWRPPYANMENLPNGYFAKATNDVCMEAWNRAADMYRQFPTDGFWAANGVSEFAGFAPDSDIFNVYGIHYGNAIALTMVSFQIPSNQITETDVMVNPAFQYTSSASEAEFSPSHYFLPAIMMHELGHALGVQTTTESYAYDVPSVMHAAYANVAAPAACLHAHDAKILRAAYASIAAIPTSKDMAVFAHRIVNSHLANTTLSAPTIPQGGAFVVQGLTIENIGNVDLANVRVRVWLSKSSMSASGVLAGDWTFPTFAKETAGTYDFVCQTPGNVAPGTWYVVTELSTPGDAVASNNVAHVKSTINVAAGPTPDDAFEPNDSPQTATTVAAGPTSGLILAPGNDDWFAINLVAGQRLEAGILFAHGAGNLDLQLYDPFLNIVDASATFVDDEWCILPIATSSGPWILRVYGASASQGNGYSLSLNVTTPAGGGGGGGQPGLPSFTPGDRLTGQLGPNAAMLERAFAGIPGMKLNLAVAMPKTLSARVRIVAPDGSTTKAFIPKSGKKTKKSIKLAAAGVFLLRFELLAGGGMFDVKTGRSLPKGAKSKSATFVSPTMGGFAQSSFLALPGTILDVKVKALGTTPDTLVKDLVRPDGTMQETAFNVDYDGLSLVDVPLALAGAWTFRLAQFPLKGQKAKVTILPTPPALGTNVIVLAVTFDFFKEPRPVTARFTIPRSQINHSPASKGPLP